MPAKDLYHDAIKTALVKDGWTITADPYRLVYEDIELYADLAAERPIAASRGQERIIVEIKSFIGRSLINDFHTALGQYIVYRQIASLNQPDHQVYLAIDDITYANFFQRQAIQLIVKANHLLLVVVDITEEEIVQWIS